MKIILVDSRARFRDDVRNRLLIDDERTVELLTDLGSLNGLETAVNRYKPDAIVFADNVYSNDTAVDIYGVAVVGYITKPVNPDLFTPNGILTYGFIENATHLLNMLEIGLPKAKFTKPNTQQSYQQQQQSPQPQQNYPQRGQYVTSNPFTDSSNGEIPMPQPQQGSAEPIRQQYPQQHMSQNQPVDMDTGNRGYPNPPFAQRVTEPQIRKEQNPFGQRNYGNTQYDSSRSSGMEYQPERYEQPYPQNRCSGAGQPSTLYNGNQAGEYGTGPQMPAYGSQQPDIKAQMDAERSFRTNATGKQSMMEDLAAKKTRTNVTTVYAAKGGVGKTTIATELSVLLSLVTQGRGTMRVCLIDFNIDFGDVLTTLNLNAKGPCLTHWTREIRRRINRGEKPDEINYSSRDIEGHLQQYKNSSLYVLVAPIAHEDSMEIESAELEVVMRNIKEYGQFDFVICDTGNNTRDSTVIALEAADQVLLIATQDVSAVNCDNRFLQTMSRIGFDTSKIRLVINSIMPYKYTQVTTKEVEDRFRYPCIARFKRDPEVTRANNCSTPLVEQPNHEFTKEMRNIVSFLTGQPDNAPEKKSGIFSIFKKKG